MKRKKPVHYAWLVALTCFMIAGGGYGIVMNCRGIFFSQLSSELHASYNRIMLSITLYGVFAIATLPFVNRTVARCRSNIVYGVSAVIFALTQAAYGIAHKLWHLYFISAVQGCAYAFLVPLSISLLINNWFVEKRGLVLGIVGASTGLFGAVMNYLCNIIIETVSWRYAYFFMGAVLFVTTVPLCFLVLRLNPAEKGLKPYGAPEHGEAAEEPQETKTERVSGSVLRSGAFIFIILVSVISGIVSGFNQFFKDFGIEKGLDPITAGNLTVISMIGNTIAKIALGWINDHKGVFAAISVCMIGMMTGIALLFSGSYYVMMIGSFLSGLMLAFNVVLVPAWTVSTFGDRDYPAIYTVVSSVLCFFSTFAFFFYSVVKSIWNTNASIMTVSFVMVALGMVLVLLQRKAGKKYRDSVCRQTVKSPDLRTE